ncbi:hypothetical protein ACI3PL_24505, partial [Lacticaseibacillus paracasei]
LFSFVLKIVTDVTNMEQIHDCDFAFVNCESICNKMYKNSHFSSRTHDPFVIRDKNNTKIHSQAQFLRTVRA